MVIQPANGAILWVVSSSDGGVLYQASTRYDAEVTHLKVTSAIDDGIFEPYERILISEVTVINSGGLPLPEGVSTFMPLTSHLLIFLDPLGSANQSHCTVTSDPNIYTFSYTKYLLSRQSGLRLPFRWRVMLSSLVAVTGRLISIFVTSSSNTTLRKFMSHPSTYLMTLLLIFS